MPDSSGQTIAAGDLITASHCRTLLCFDTLITAKGLVLSGEERHESVEIYTYTIPKATGTDSVGWPDKAFIVLADLTTAITLHTTSRSYVLRLLKQFRALEYEPQRIDINNDVALVYSSPAHPNLELMIISPHPAEKDKKEVSSYTICLLRNPQRNTELEKSE